MVKESSRKTSLTKFYRMVVNLSDIKNPFFKLHGKIEKITTDGTIYIKAKCNNISNVIGKMNDDILIEFVDKRKLSSSQRKMVWAMIGEIAEWQGESKSSTNESMKMDFLLEELNEDFDKMFSLSDAPMSVISSYQKYLINFIIENNIPTKKPLVEYADDINSYIYSCMLNKRCAVCGKKADIHHIDRVGMGRDRDDIVHIGMEALPLCREHHTEAHTMTDREFFLKYHFDGGIKIDKKICEVYNLNGK